MMNTNQQTEVTVPTAWSKWLLILGALAAVLVAAGVIDRERNLSMLQRVADDNAVPVVQVTQPEPGPIMHTLTLPGNIHAWYSAPIYAQVSGYVQRWYKDYGAPVKAGDVLANIDAPAVDEQYQSALADLDVAKTNYNLAQVTAQRWLALAGTQAVSQQEVDVKVADEQAQKARVRVAQHEVQRYQVLEGFKRIVAPFDGVVTSRNTDIGNYVNAAGGDVGSRGAADELFSVADIHEMRVFVSVPQDYAAMLRPGLTATLSLPQYPDKVFNATFDTSANAVDPQTRTVVTELLVPNPDHLLWPGTYASVHFNMPLDKGVLVVPEQALLFRADGMQVALVDQNDHVHLQDVRLGLNFGKTVQVLSGLTPSDRLIVSPSAGLLEGQTVQVADHAVNTERADPVPAGPGATEAAQ
jgi:membrane fusion protein, multidrug efflux system